MRIGKITLSTADHKAIRDDAVGGQCDIDQFGKDRCARELKHGSTGIHLDDIERQTSSMQNLFMRGFHGNLRFASCLHSPGQVHRSACRHPARGRINAHTILLPCSLPAMALPSLATCGRCQLLQAASAAASAAVSYFRPPATSDTSAATSAPAPPSGAPCADRAPVCVFSCDLPHVHA